MSRWLRVPRGCCRQLGRCPLESTLAVGGQAATARALQQVTLVLMLTHAVHTATAGEQLACVWPT